MLLFRDLQYMLFICMYLLMPLGLQASNREVSDSVFERIMQSPESIVSYSTKELIGDIDEERIEHICKLICSLNANGVSRSIIKEHYYPLCRTIIEASLRQSGILYEITKRRGLIISHIKQADSISSGRYIITRLIEYQNVCKTILNLSSQKIITPFAYGDMRFVENFVWGESKYMNELNPIPKRIKVSISNLYNNKNCDVEKCMYDVLLELCSEEHDSVLKNSKILLEASTYLPRFQMEVIFKNICGEYINEGKKHAFIDLCINVFSKIYGENISKLRYILEYKMLEAFNIYKVEDFRYYRDSLLSKHVEFSKYYPQNCPYDLKQSVEYEEYSNRFYDAIDYIFTHFMLVGSIDRSSSDFNILNVVGCNSQVELLRVYVEETLRRYYDKGDFKMWGNIEKIREYIEKTSEYPTDVALHIAECYASINALAAKDFIRRISLETWLNQQMEKGQPSKSLLDAASVIVYVYASLNNKLRYPKVLEYIKWVEENIELIGDSKDGVVYNIAYALYIMEKYKESNVWISKIQIEKSEYNQEFYRLLLRNYCELGEMKEAIKVASEMNGYSYEDILYYYLAKFGEGEKGDLDFLLSTFTTSLSDDFNQILSLNSDDQEWSLLVAKDRLDILLCDMQISMWAKDELNDGYDSLFKQCFAAMYYNYALASKGAILRSNKKMRELVLNKMPTEQAQYYQQVLNFEEDENKVDCISDNMDKFCLDQSRGILLDYVRRNAANNFPKFDYNIVRNQLKTEDIAIEVIRNGVTNSYNITMIRKDWEFPKLIELNDNRQLLWKTIDPFLVGVKNIYISLDAEYNLDNIELLEDSTGFCMADKYKIYRVSTTLNIPKDIYISDIKHSVLYGNLKYADWEDLVKADEIKKNRNRGAFGDYWLPLLDTKKELREIVEILSNKKILYELYEKENGDKASFKALNRQNVELLHLATHGFFNSEKESDEDVSAMKRSGIVLSNSSYDLRFKKQSGTLFANEISNMDLNSVKLLVLSACETANGELGDDGVFGLQRGFKQAGVGCIIMSLKKVNSKMATDLMTEFYSSFAKGESVRDAFRYAQKQIAKKYDIEDWKYFVILD